MASKRLSNVQFLTVCDIARNKREEIVRDCHGHKALAAYLAKASGIDVSDASVSAILEATNIKLECRHTGRLRNMRVVLRVLLSLLEKLGEKAPQDLLACYEAFNGKPWVGAKPVPASTVVDPKTMHVVNK